MRAVGIDIGVRKGLDVVVLDETLAPVELRRRLSPEELTDVLSAAAPDVVAIDSPPSWGRSKGGSRMTEREIRRWGIQSYGTPSDPKRAEGPFYEWMRVGFRAFEAAARAGFPRYAGGRPRGTAMEVFPHGSAVVLAGCLPPPSTGKREWRASVLRARGVRVEELRSADQVDAALAALTGLEALRGHLFAPGDPKEGVIVLPARSLPPPPYRRCPGARRSSAQTVLPGLTRCGCGDPRCTLSTSAEFARGHDSRRKSLLWKTAREGQDAAAELRRRGWQLPPEMR